MENTLDWLSYVSENNLVRVTRDTLFLFNLQAPEKVGKVPGAYQINYVKFFENPGLVQSTRELMTKLDFSETGPHNIWVRHATSTSYVIGGIDTSFNRLYWFGLDFTQVKIKLGTAKRLEYSQPFFMDCNDYILSEDGFKEFSSSFSFKIDTGIVIDRNNNMNVVNIFNKNSQVLPLDTIRNILLKFPKSYDGIGLVVFVTEVDKLAELQTFYVTFFDIQSKTVLLCLKETQSTKGVGMANHWTKAIKGYLEGLLKKNTWRKRYIGKG